MKKVYLEPVIVNNTDPNHYKGLNIKREIFNYKFKEKLIKKEIKQTNNDYNAFLNNTSDENYNNNNFSLVDENYLVDSNVVLTDINDKVKAYGKSSNNRIILSNRDNGNKNTSNYNSNYNSKTLTLNRIKSNNSSFIKNNNTSNKYNKTFTDFKITSIMNKERFKSSKFNVNNYNTINNINNNDNRYNTTSQTISSSNNTRKQSNKTFFNIRSKSKEARLKTPNFNQYNSYLYYKKKLLAKELVEKLKHYKDNINSNIELTTKSNIPFQNIHQQEEYFYKTFNKLSGFNKNSNRNIIKKHNLNKEKDDNANKINNDIIEDNYSIISNRNTNNTNNINFNENRKVFVNTDLIKNNFSYVYKDLFFDKYGNKDTQVKNQNGEEDQDYLKYLKNKGFKKIEHDYVSLETLRDLSPQQIKYLKSRTKATPSTRAIYTSMSNRKHEVIDFFKKHVTTTPIKIQSLDSQLKESSFININKNISNILDKRKEDVIPVLFPVAYVHESDFSSYSEANRYQKTLQELMNLKYILEQNQGNSESLVKEFLLKRGFKNELITMLSVHNIYNFLMKRTFSIKSNLTLNENLLFIMLGKEEFYEYKKYAMDNNNNNKINNFYNTTSGLNINNNSNSNSNKRNINNHTKSHNFSHNNSITFNNIYGNTYQNVPKTKRNKNNHNSNSNSNINSVVNRSRSNSNNNKNFKQHISPIPSKTISKAQQHKTKLTLKQQEEREREIILRTYKKSPHIEVSQVNNKNNSDEIIKELNSQLEKLNIPENEFEHIKPNDEYFNKKRLYQISIKPIPCKPAEIQESIKNSNRAKFGQKKKLLEYVMFQELNNNNYYSKELEKLELDAKERLKNIKSKSKTNKKNLLFGIS